MPIPEKTINVAGRSVVVEAVQELTPDGITILRVTARTGTTSYTGVQTVSPNPNLTVAQMQKDLDDFRQKIAEEAAGREVTRTLAALLK